MKKAESWFWILEDGTVYSAEQVEHKFDDLVKKVIKRRALNAVRDEINERKKFPILPGDVFDGIGAVEVDYDIEKSEVRLNKTFWYLGNEDLADALEKLEPREKEYVELSFLMEWKPEEIAKHFCVTVEYVYLLRHRILGKLRKWMEDEDGTPKL